MFRLIKCFTFYPKSAEVTSCELPPYYGIENVKWYESSRLNNVIESCYVRRCWVINVSGTLDVRWLYINNIACCTTIVRVQNMLAPWPLCIQQAWGSFNDRLCSTAILASLLGSDKRYMISSLYPEVHNCHALLPQIARGKMSTL